MIFDRCPNNVSKYTLHEFQGNIHARGKAAAVMAKLGILDALKYANCCAGGQTKNSIPLATTGQ